MEHYPDTRSIDPNQPFGHTNKIFPVFNKTDTCKIDPTQILNTSQELFLARQPTRTPSPRVVSSAAAISTRPPTRLSCCCRPHSLTSVPTENSWPVMDRGIGSSAGRGIRMGKVWSKLGRKIASSNNIVLS